MNVHEFPLHTASDMEECRDVTPQSAKDNRDYMVFYTLKTSLDKLIKWFTKNNTFNYWKDITFIVSLQIYVEQSTQIVFVSGSSIFLKTEKHKATFRTRTFGTDHELPFQYYFVNLNTIYYITMYLLFSTTVLIFFIPHYNNKYYLHFIINIAFICIDLYFITKWDNKFKRSNIGRRYMDIKWFKMCITNL